jgi:hypothetical protein
VREVEGKSASRQAPEFPRRGRLKFVSVMVVAGGWKELRIVSCCDFGVCGTAHSIADIVISIYLS